MPLGYAYAIPYIISMAYSYLHWDSDFFGKKIYKIDSFAEILAEDWDTVIKEQPDLIYCAIENPTLATIEFMKKQGAILYDKKVQFYKSDFNVETAVNNDFHCESTTILTEELESMVYQSGAFSRFKLDPHLSFKFKDLYKEWILGSLNRRLADEVLIAIDREGKNAGFITLSVKNGKGNIGLIAVNEQTRGKGVGKFLMLQADRFFKEKQASEATVVTQLDNIPACRLYEKMGYIILKNESIYHYYAKK